MPELPEVELTVRGLRQPLVGRTFQGAAFPKPPRRMINLSPEQFAERAAGFTIHHIQRRAKYLLFEGKREGSLCYLIVHLKMTGHLYVLPPDAQDSYDRWLRVTFPLDNGQELRFSDSRRFGRTYLVDHPDQVLPDLGPEPLADDFTIQAFTERLRGRKGVLKSLLMDQSFIAGVGNIYADEALHIARLHPLRKAHTLAEADIVRLYHAVRQALNDGLRYDGASIGWYRLPDGSKGQSQEHFRAYRSRRTQHIPCPVCGTPITTIRVGQRGTHFCPTCQTLD